MAGVSLRDVRKVFAGSTVAVRDLDIDIADGEFVSLLGPSGCGKTTTLRMLAGLEEPTSGGIYIGDRAVNNVAPGKRDIAMVFQSYALYPHMTVMQNIEYPLKKRKVAKAERRQRAAKVAELLQIEALAGRKPRQLSGGQQQRVALGRAIVRDPEVFLLDEPLSNLDAKLRSYMRAELIQLHRRLGKTMVYVTHDQLEAMTMSDRIAILQDGVLQQFATPAEIYNQPVNRFVASFVGTPSMNFVDGELTGTGDQLGFRSPAIGFELAGRPRGDLNAQGGVTAGIRPEDVLIGEGDQRAQVTVVEPTGHESLVFLQAGPAQLVARVGADHPVKALEQVAFSIRRDRVHLFDKVSEQRVETVIAD